MGARPRPTFWLSRTWQQGQAPRPQARIIEPQVETILRRVPRMAGLAWSAGQTDERLIVVATGSQFQVVGRNRRGASGARCHEGGDGAAQPVAPIVGRHKWVEPGEQANQEVVSRRRQAFAPAYQPGRMPYCSLDVERSARIA